MKFNKSKTLVGKTKSVNKQEKLNDDEPLVKVDLSRKISKESPSPLK
jgi:hypothetical protein